MGSGHGYEGEEEEEEESAPREIAAEESAAPGGFCASGIHCHGAGKRDLRLPKAMHEDSTAACMALDEHGGAAGVSLREALSTEEARVCKKCFASLHRRSQPEKGLASQKWRGPAMGRAAARFSILMHQSPHVAPLRAPCELHLNERDAEEREPASKSIFRHQLEPKLQGIIEKTAQELGEGMEGIMHCKKDAIDLSVKSAAKALAALKLGDKSPDAAEKIASERRELGKQHRNNARKRESGDAHIWPMQESLKTAPTIMWASIALLMEGCRERRKRRKLRGAWKENWPRNPRKAPDVNGMTAFEKTSSRQTGSNGDICWHGRQKQRPNKSCGVSYGEKICNTRCSPAIEASRRHNGKESGEEIS